MTVIRPDQPLCTVIVTVDAETETMAVLEPHAREGLARFAKLKGLISGALHLSDDGRRLIQYLQWETEADHLACMNDPGWDELPSTKRFLEMVQSGRAKMHVQTYTVIAASERSESHRSRRVHSPDCPPPGGSSEEPGGAEVD